MAAMIRVEDAGVAFGSRWIFRNVSLAVARGELLAILGRNGRGKTTLLRALLGLQPWSSGHAEVDGAIGFVAQTAETPFAYSVLDIVLMGRARHLRTFQLPGPADYAAAREALAVLGLQQFEQRRIDEISGGERQLVMIARALASSSGALLLDEPTSSLDFRNQDVILATMRRMAREHGLAVIFSSQYPQHALHIADKVLLMNDVDHNPCGPTDTLLTEAVLTRLYDFPIRRVEVAHEEGTFSTLVPVFS
jgi:iron complex transport system ATP-binding protein